MTAVSALGLPTSRSSTVLPRRAPVAILGGAIAVGAGVMAAVGWNWYGAATLALLLYVVAIYTASRVVEGRRKAKDRLVTAIVTSAFLIALVPLVSLAVTVVSKGTHALNAAFFTHDMRSVVGAGGGIKHAIIGTLLITAFATFISVPIGLLASVYLVEYGHGWLARVITFLVDVMTGIPSIVAGLFSVALFSIFLGLGVRIGVGGSVALSVLMIPIVVRSTEEMLRLVPDELREASYALGVPKWRTIVRIVLPTSMAGIVTGVMLAVARIVGETAPLLIIAGYAQSTNWNLFSGRMTTLPVFSYQWYAQPQIPVQAGYDRAWATALVLIAIVMILNLIARMISRFFSPKTR